MKKSVWWRIFVLGLVFVVLLPSQGIVLAENTESEDVPQFTNQSVHDPSIVKVGDTYYAFGSHIEAAKSKNLMDWESFANGYTTPDNQLFGDLSENLAESFAWAGEDDSDSKGGYAIWAPDVFWNKDYMNEDGTKGAYLMYYSASSTYIRSAIGVAASQDIEGPYEYVDTIVYSGFTKDESYDADSQVNKQWKQTNLASLIDDGVLKDVRASWFNGNDYNNQVFPNAIDPNLFYDENGKLWMSYGSWSGGIFVLEIDPATGQAIYPGEDGTTDDGRLIDRYFGTKISGGFGKSGEGPYVIYDDSTGYYYLYVTYGWLAADGEYNMRVFRAENPEGPYLDIKGQNAVLTSSADHADIGNKLFGHFKFERNVGDPGTGVGYGYVSAGHNSVHIDPETNEQYLVFHTRFPNRGEVHELRIHQIFMNEDDWPVVAPSRYTGETLQKMEESNVIGEYRYVNHEKDNSNTIKSARTISLNEDGSITGAVNGNWELINENEAMLTIGDSKFSGVFLEQWNEVTQTTQPAFTAVSDEGKSIWGIKTFDRTDQEIVETIENELTVENANGVIANIALPTEGISGAKITWKSSNPEIVSEEGKVNRPKAGNEDAVVTLTATITKGDYSLEKEIEITVLAHTEAKLVAHYAFEGNLEEENQLRDAGEVVGKTIEEEGGSIEYVEGRKGQAVKFDGNTGVLLPSGLIASDQYTVSLWLQPSELTLHTTAFFGARTSEDWISLVPSGHKDGETMVWSTSNGNWYDGTLGMTIPTDEWSLLTLAVDKGQVDIYINGENLHTGKNFNDIFTTKDATFSLGVNYWDTPYQGLIDELLIYDHIALSEEQIKEYYETGEVPVVDQEIDVSSLEDLIVEAKSYDKELYSESSYSVLESAITDAETGLTTITSEDELTTAVSALQAAIDQLEKRDSEVIDLTELEDLLAKAKAIKNNQQYSKESFEDLQLAIQTVESTIDEIKTEEELAELLSILQTALNDLTEIDKEDPSDDSSGVKDNDEEKENPEGGENQENDGDAKPLPNTATTMYTSLLIGFALLMIAGITFVIYRKKRLSSEK